MKIALVRCRSEDGRDARCPGSLMPPAGLMRLLGWLRALRIEGLHVYVADGPTGRDIEDGTDMAAFEIGVRNWTQSLEFAGWMKAWDERIHTVAFGPGVATRKASLTHVDLIVQGGRVPPLVPRVVELQGLHLLVGRRVVISVERHGASALQFDRRPEAGLDHRVIL